MFSFGASNDLVVVKTKEISINKEFTIQKLEAIIYSVPSPDLNLVHKITHGFKTMKYKQ